MLLSCHSESLAELFRSIGVFYVVATSNKVYDSSCNEFFINFIERIYLHEESIETSFIQALKPLKGEQSLFALLL